LQKNLYGGWCFCHQPDKRNHSLNFFIHQQTEYVSVGTPVPASQHPVYYIMQPAQKLVSCKLSCHQLLFIVLTDIHQVMVIFQFSQKRLFVDKHAGFFGPDACFTPNQQLQDTQPVRTYRTDSSLICQLTWKGMSYFVYDCSLTKVSIL